MTLISYVLTSFLVGTITTFSNHGKSFSTDFENAASNNEATQKGRRSLLKTLNEDDRLSARDEKLLKELVDALNAPVRSLDSTVRSLDSTVRSLDSTVRSNNRKNLEGGLNDGPTGNDSGFDQKTDSVISVSNNDKESVPDTNIDFNLHNEESVDSDGKIVTNKPSMEKQSDIDFDRLLPPSEETPLEINESDSVYEQTIKNEDSTDSIQKDVLNEQTKDVLSQKGDFYIQQESDMENAPPEEEPINEEYLPTNTEEGFDADVLDSNIKSDTDMKLLEAIPDDVKTDFVDNSEKVNSENSYRGPLKNTPFKDESASDAVRAGTSKYDNNDNEEKDGNDAVFSRNNDGDDDENNVWGSGRLRGNNYELKKRRLDYFLNKLKHGSKHIDSLNTFNAITRDRSRYNSANDYYNS